MSATYRILDEPAGGRGNALVFNPFWPLLAMMLAGAWLGIAMFAVNAITLRSQTWKRELGLVAAIPLGACVIVFAIIEANVLKFLPERAIPYTLLLITVWKFALAYWIFFLQQGAFALYEYFRPYAQNSPSAQLGAGLVVVGMFVRSNVLGAFDDNPFWIWALR